MNEGKIVKYYSLLLDLHSEYNIHSILILKKE